MIGTTDVCLLIERVHNKTIMKVTILICLSLLISSCSYFIDQNISSTKDAVELLISGMNDSNYHKLKTSFSDELTSTEFLPDQSNEEYFEGLLYLINRFCGKIENYNSKMISTPSMFGNSTSPIFNMFVYDINFTIGSAKLKGNVNENHLITDYNIIFDTCQKPLEIGKYDDKIISLLSNQEYNKLYKEFGEDFKASSYTIEKLQTEFPQIYSTVYDDFRFYNFDFGWLDTGKKFIRTQYKVDYGNRLIYFQYSIDADEKISLDGILYQDLGTY